jgi:hypothetical protein
MVLWPSYLGTIFSIWQIEGHILQQGLGMHSENMKSLFPFLALPSNPMLFQIIFSTLKVVCAQMEPVALFQV